MKVILYSTHCPRCNILAQKLKDKNVEFEEVNDIEIMEEKGIRVAPMMELDGEMMDYGAAVKWVNNLNS